ncbi:glycosyltransferase family 2 protein [Glycomyces tenuis]|uniref:glycosyltransferase family 2 protein n=1 Tax=Glycomyces tenuis TaxID=58116 RepID=UPI000428634C|nr:glycosyltransferase [Glycomyces tenuis]
MNRPDVTVIMAVYNTMPYLSETLESLLSQTIGADRFELIAVDDGSTDGSGEELDRYAAKFPDTVTVVHQENSGGPAAPSNLAIERASGRYMFFIGADDHLGPEALERMVAAADEYESDVLVAKMVGVNGKGVSKQAFAKSGPDVGLYDSKLPWALSNTKLFRRELIEDHRLRYPEDMPFGSDQPFTIEAMVKAGRISVLDDYDYYFAVRRADGSNITYSSDHRRRLECAARIMDFTAELLPPGAERDALLQRHFYVELCNLLRSDLLELDEAVQRDVVDGVGALADRYLTERIRDALGVHRRLRIGLAQRRDLVGLRAHLESGDWPVFHIEADGVFAAYPAFRDAAAELPDHWFLLGNEKATGRLVKRLRVTALEPEDGAVRIECRIGLSGSPTVRLGAVRVTRHAGGPKRSPIAEAPGFDIDTESTSAVEDGELAVRAMVPIERLAEAGTAWAIRAHVHLGEWVYDLPLPAQAEPWRREARRGLRRWRLATVNDPRDRLVVTAEAVATPIRRGMRRLKSTMTGK